MGTQKRPGDYKYGLHDFEDFVLNDLELEDVNFERGANGYKDRYTQCLHILWEQGWSSGYDYGYDNGTRDERIEHSDKAFSRGGLF